MNAPAHDNGRLALMLNELRLPTIGRLWPEFAERSDKEGWPAARLLGALLEHELAERAQRRIERHRSESHLNPTKTLATFDFGMVPMVSKAHVTTLASGESWLEKGATILLFGPPGAGKSHLGAAIGHALIDSGYRVLFMRTSELVQKLQAARQSLQLPSALTKLDRFDLIILDDLSYARKDQAETSVLFELIAEGYERKSLLITANQPFSGWNDVFFDPGMTVAAIDRLVHHSTIFELNVESYRRRKASDKQSARRRQLPSDNYTRRPAKIIGADRPYRLTLSRLRLRLCPKLYRLETTFDNARDFLDASGAEESAMPNLLCTLCTSLGFEFTICDLSCMCSQRPLVELSLVEGISMDHGYQLGEIEQENQHTNAKASN